MSEEYEVIRTMRQFYRDGVSIIENKHFIPRTMQVSTDIFEQLKTPDTGWKEALRLLRDLADLQNGPPLIRHEKQWTGTMDEVYTFLTKHEEKT